MPAGEAALSDAARDLFKDRGAARAIGQAYLSAYPSEGRRKILIELSASVSGFDAADDGFGMEPRGDRLIRLGRADFAAGRTVQIDGWILSRTEARLCALAALDRSESHVR